MFFFYIDVGIPGIVTEKKEVFSSFLFTTHVLAVHRSINLYNFNVYMVQV